MTITSTRSRPASIKCLPGPPQVDQRATGLRVPSGLLRTVL